MPRPRTIRRRRSPSSWPSSPTPSSPGTTSSSCEPRPSSRSCVKGILHPDDARAARDREIDGVVVSNHGGRQVDGEIAALDALPAIADAVGDDLAVVFDSGIRSGADVVKALALGADAVLLGRPYLWGLALGGEAGVLAVLRAILAELDLTVGLSGQRRIADLGPELLAREGDAPG